MLAPCALVSYLFNVHFFFSVSSSTYSAVNIYLLDKVIVHVHVICPLLGIDCLRFTSIIIIIIIMGLRSVSASKDVIGDPSRPGINNSELLEPRREEGEKVLG